MLPCSCYNLHFLSRIQWKEVAIFAGPRVWGREAALPKRKLSRCRVCGGQNPRPWRFQVFQDNLFQTNHKFTNLHVCTASCVFEQMWVLRIQSRVRFVSSDLHCRGVLVAVQRRRQLFHTRSCHLGPGQSDVGHSLGHHHPSVGHRCLFFSKLLPLGDQALSAAIMFASPCGQCDRYLPNKNVLYICTKSFVTPPSFHLCEVKRTLGNLRCSWNDSHPEEYLSE